MEGRDKPELGGGSALIDITTVPLEHLESLESPILRKLIDELAARADHDERPFDFSSAL